MSAAVWGQASQEQLAAHYYANGDFAQAAQLYETLYKAAPQRFYYQRLLSSYVEMGEFRDAVRLTERRFKGYPKELGVLVDRGGVLIRAGQKKKGEKCFDEAIERLDRDQQPVAGLVQAFESLGRHDRAVAVYRRMREVTKSPYLYFAELVGEYQHMGDYEAMTEEYFNLLDHQPGMMHSVQVSMQRALVEAPDGRLSSGVRQALVSRIQEHPDNRTYQEMMIWYALQEKDFAFAAMQAKAVSQRQPEVGGEQLLRVAKIASQNKAYEVAADCYATLRQRGPGDSRYFEARMGELEAEFAMVNDAVSPDASRVSQLRQHYAEALAELGKNERTVPLMRSYASLLAYHGGDMQEAVSLLDDVLEIPRLRPQVRDEVKLELGDLLLFAGEVLDASLLYMQVEKANKDDVLGSTAKLRNARLSYFNHDFEWAVSQLKVLRASTTKLIANDAMELSLLISDNMEDDSTYGTLELFADGDLMLYRGLLDSAWADYEAVQRTNLSHPLLDEVLLRQAEIRTRQGRYEEADSLLVRLVESYPYDITADDALIMRAELNDFHLDRPQVARECYEKLILDYPTSLYVDRARKRYNQLNEK